MHGNQRERRVDPSLDGSDRRVNPSLDLSERHAPSSLLHGRHVDIPRSRQERRVDHAFGQHDVNVRILKRNPVTREASSNVGKLLMGSSKPLVEAHGAQIGSKDIRKSLLGSMAPLGSDPIVVGSVDPIADNSGPISLDLVRAQETLVLVGPTGKPIPLFEASINKGLEGQGPLVSSEAPSWDLFCGVPRSNPGIASKRLDALPPIGFKWQFIAGLWSLVPTMVLSQPFSQK